MGSVGPRKCKRFPSDKYALSGNTDLVYSTPYVLLQTTRKSVHVGPYDL